MGEVDGVPEGDAVGEELGTREEVGDMDTVGEKVVGVRVGEAQLDGSSSSAESPSVVVVAVAVSLSSPLVVSVPTTFTGCHSSKISFPI